MRSFELKLSTGKVVAWDGVDGVDAVRAYVAGHSEATVVAWRNTNRVGMFEYHAERMDRVRIIEPTPGMGG